MAGNPVGDADSGTVVGVRVIAIDSTDSPRRSRAQQQHQGDGTKKEDRSFFIQVAKNHDAIEALSGVAAVVVAIGLAIVTGLLWRATRRLASSTRELAAGATDQVAEMRKSYDLSEKQYLLAGRQTDLTEKRHGLQRHQFYAQYPPKLAIQFVSRLPIDAAYPADEQDIAVEFVISNTGNSEGTVIGSRVALAWMSPAGIPVPGELKGEDVFPHRRFLAGATDKAVVRSDRSAGLVEAMKDGRELFLLGWVVYVDGRGKEFGSSRTTYFLRQFDAGTKRFIIAPAQGWFDWEWESTT